VVTRGAGRAYQKREVLNGAKTRQNRAKTGEIERFLAKNEPILQSLFALFSPYCFL